MYLRAILENLLLDGTKLDPSEFTVAKAIKEGKCYTPPTYITHGTIDDKVPIVQAEDVVNAMKAKNLEVEFDAVEGADHLFDREEKCSMDSMYEFVKRTLGVKA